MSTPIVDLGQVSILAELIVRGGNAQQSDARLLLQRAYERPDDLYPDVTGLSTFFRPHTSLDDLARENPLPNAQLSWSIVGELTQALAAIGYAMCLYVTPTPELPDHHTLAVLHNGQVQATITDTVADALLQAMRVVDNPYRQSKRPQA